MNYFNRFIKFLNKGDYSNKELDTSQNMDYENSSKNEKGLEFIYPNMTDEEIWDAIVKKNEDDWTYEESDFNLRMILNTEFLSGRMKAIKELLNNECEIEMDEYKNPFKELTDFTLNYFKNHYIEKPEDALSLLENSFPIMNQYIYRVITNKKIVIDIESYFDYQKAYDEFLIFCKNYFCSKFSDKLIRDQQIKKDFKLIHNDFINFIDNDKY